MLLISRKTADTEPKCQTTALANKQTDLANRNVHYFANSKCVGRERTLDYR